MGGTDDEVTTACRGADTCPSTRLSPLANGQVDRETSGLQEPTVGPRWQRCL